MAFSLQDHFTNLPDDEEEAYDYEETYDGLGDRLDETLDEFNDETFGGGADMGREFDFFGKTAKVADVLEEEQMTYARSHGMQQPPPTQAARQAEIQHQQQRTNYLRQQSQPQPMPNIRTKPLAPNPAIWGNLESTAQEPPKPAKKYLSLEEVEAQLLASQRPAQQVSVPPSAQNPPQPFAQPQIPSGLPAPQHVGQQQYYEDNTQFKPMQYQQAPQYQKQMPPPPQQGGFGPPSHAPMAPQRSPQRSPVRQAQVPPQRPLSLGGINPPPNFQEIMAAENQRLVAEDAKRRKRNEKISQMAQYNGLMTPADKNFIQRISISQLLADPSQPHLEDFYYQVHTAIRSRSHPNQPLNSMAQTYLRGRGKRLMETQVMRAVQHARSRPKQEALSLEGALGKIAFHGSGRPRALLDVRKPINAEENKALGDKDRHSERRVLRAIESAYDILLDLEEERRPGGSALSDERRQGLLDRLWDTLGVMEPIDQGNVLHPFIAFLSYLKGKKAMPRVFLVINPDQRLTILTMIIAHLQQLDVIAQGHHPPQSPSLPPSIQESIETFLSSVIPPIVPLIETSHLGILIGLMGILLDRNSLPFIAETKIGLAFLTLLLSRSQIIFNGDTPADEAEVREWKATFDKFFALMQGSWSNIFPPRGAWGDDVYVWQFLASVAVGANMEQQHVLVTECRDRVLDNVIASKNLPPEIAKSKIDNTNLFLRAMGLDAGMLS